MMRSLYTAASGMKSQQINVDVIANNLANVNSTGYKTSSAEFKSLLYQTLQTRSTSANGDYKPVPAQVGTGARNSAITTRFSQGNQLATANEFGFCIDGEGFFAVMSSTGDTLFTRNGDFQMAIASDGGFMLCTQEGYPVLDVDGLPIAFSPEFEVSKISVAGDGTICYPDENNNLQSMGIKIGIYQVANPAGFDNVGDTMYRVAEASGEAFEESTNPNLKRSKIIQGYLEGSNVQVADEMVNLIVAQRAYEMNSKAIQASDEMLGQANSLRR